MLFTALSIGALSLVLFAAGLFGLLYIPNIIAIFALFIAAEVMYIYKKRRSITFSLSGFSLFQKFLIGLLLLQSVVNFIGVLGPELGFDALWYHLTLPKIFLEHHKVFFIPGDLLYYSLFPKLTEMLYLVPLSLGSEAGAKFIHFSFGILTLVLLYKTSRIFLNKTFSLLVLTVFYSNPVVGWESITGYVDLARTFFELFAFYYFVTFLKTGNKKNIITSGMLLGLGISVKTLSLGSLPLYALLLIFSKSKSKVSSMMLLILSAALTSILWFVYAYISSGNPFYPLFSSRYSDLGQGYASVIQAGKDLFILSFYSPDPISPLYILFIPLIGITFNKMKGVEKTLLFYSFLAIMLWTITPRTGTSRFLLPYLPVMSIAVTLPLKYLKDKFYIKTAYVLITLCMLISIFYRGAANTKFIPYIVGSESKEEFLMNYLNFSYGDFYDEEQAIKEIVGQKKVLTVGLHNLYYIDFPFVDSSYVRNGEEFNYVLVQNAILPSRFSTAKLAYVNSKTHVKLYDVGKTLW
ncbi:MAG: ArnT family glycosyltransferase [Candidatus Levyibacteriota bacterium]